MDPITSSAVSAILVVASDAAKETTTQIAKAAWIKLKERLGWANDPAPDEIRIRAEQTLSDRPDLAKQAAAIGADYRQQIELGNVSLGTVDLRGANVQQVKQVNIGRNSGPMTF